MNRTLLKFYSTKDVLFSSISHTWLQYCNDNIARIGITSRGLEDIGSVDYIMPLLKPRDLITTNTPFIEIGWTAYQISTADELYHTTWNNIEGSYSIKCPILCTLRRLHDDALCNPEDICDKTWLAEVELNNEESLTCLLDRNSYNEHISEIGRGLFAEELT